METVGGGGGSDGAGAGDAVAGLLAAVQALVAEALASRSSRLVDLYRSLPTGDHDGMIASGEVVAGILPENIEKNRYSNICPYDARRVVLRRRCDDAASSSTDYINASHVELPAVRAIASQGPTHPQWHGPDTTGDFWAAVWEQGSEVVVALAKVQAGFSGSARYWPEAAGQRMVATGWPELSVTLLSEENGPHFTTRHLQLELSQAAAAGDADAAAPSSSSSATTREVTHFHYDRWPNYGVPEAPDDVAALLRAVEEMESARLARVSAEPELDAAQPPPPVWVHCSGGVGRSGVFLTALSVYRSIFPTVPTGATPAAVPMADGQAFAEAMVGRVAALRQQRHPWMVEGDAQHVFAHEVVLRECAATAGVSLPSARR
jgi:protein tyrosine phosphatase